MRGFVTPSYTEWFAKGIFGAVKETEICRVGAGWAAKKKIRVDSLLLLIRDTRDDFE